MNIIAIMGPHGVFYKDEPIKELESALVAQGFQIIWPQNSVDLLKFIEHNPRICGVILTGMSTVSIYVAISINNEYLRFYAFINTHSTMDVSVQDMRMALWFFEYALGQAEDIAIRMRQYTNEYLDNITPPFTKTLFTYVKERRSTPFVRRGIWAVPHIKKSPVGCLFYDFFGGNTLKADVSISVTELGSLLDHTGNTPGSGRVHRADVWRGTGISLLMEHRRRTKLWVCTPRHPAVRC